eukprot:2247484-Pyramimonas_sp.AAC.1
MLRWIVEKNFDQSIDRHAPNVPINCADSISKAWNTDTSWASCVGRAPCIASGIQLSLQGVVSIHLTCCHAAINGEKFEIIL